jgi:hypothetical protein
MSLFEQTVEVYSPGIEDTDWGWDNGVFFDTNREPEEADLQIDPMTQGQLKRMMGVDGFWTGGAIHITSESTPLYPENQKTGRPADWVKYKDDFYAVIYIKPWDDSDLPSYEMAAHLMRPQPTI